MLGVKPVAGKFEGQISQFPHGAEIGWNQSYAFHFLVVLMSQPAQKRKRWFDGGDDNDATDGERLCTECGEPAPHAYDYEHFTCAAVQAPATTVEEILRSLPRGDIGDPDAFVAAARHNRVDVVEAFLRHGADRVSRNEAFVEAACSGSIESMELLLQRGANIHYEKGLALECAAGKGQVAVVERLLQRGARIHPHGANAIRWASLNGHTEVVEVLIRHGAPIRAVALRDAISGGHSATADLLLRNGAHYNRGKALWIAAEEKDSATLEVLLRYGAGAHVSAARALDSAASWSHAEGVKLLLDHGVWSDRAPDLMVSAAGWGNVAGNITIVELFLQHGVDVHARCDGALLNAAEHGNVQMVQLLLRAGADVHAQDDQALQLAAHKGHVATVRLLLEHGARVPPTCTNTIATAVQQLIASETLLLCVARLEQSGAFPLLDRELWHEMLKPTVCLNKRF
jgi:ankyrin repeat protein